MSLGALVQRSASVVVIRQYIEGLTPAERSMECLGLTTAQQRRLWQLTAADETRSRGDLVRGSSAVFAGRNSLGMFSRFEKWFARQDGAIIGCNRHPLSPLIGPGYFTVREPAGEDLEFDYETVPAVAPPGWPRTRPNSGLFSRPVYGGLLDRVTWLSNDVLIGAALRRGMPLDSYFILVRVT